jgi:hypothetical protein
MFERIGTGFRLAKVSWRVLLADRSLAVFPLISAISCILSMVLIMAPGALGVDWSSTTSDGGSIPSVMYVRGVVALFVTTFLTIFFNVALASCAARSMEGADTTLREGIAAASARLPQILGWALIAFFAGLLLRALDAIADQAPFPFNIIANVGVWLLGMAWSAVTFLVIPVLALEQVGPKEALDRSKNLIIQRWGEGLAGNVGIGLAVAICGYLPAILIMVLGGMTMATSVALGGALLAVGLALMVLTIVIGATLNQVFAVALYRFASGGEIPAGFTSHDMQTAFRPRKQRR